MQYRFFGDVITFNTTYRTNLYDVPFGVLVGVNNHFQSIILARVLIRDEQQESFEWVFSQFLRMMGGPVPGTILTDRNRAMELAIAKVYPEAVHTWCKWHVLKRPRNHWVHCTLGRMTLRPISTRWRQKKHMGRRRRPAGAPRFLLHLEKKQMVRERCCRAASVKQEVELESVEDGLEEGFGDHDPTAEVPMDGGVVENPSYVGSRVIGSLEEGDEGEGEVTSRVAKRKRTKA
ncbi:Protein FAR1-RELATED SEQUENCE 5 [Hordeum vulgare]|nr:Protein FAR1-RELATED SEQUENCE 5 [Hordeum vulgare]